MDLTETTNNRWCLAIPQKIWITPFDRERGKSGFREEKGIGGGKSWVWEFVKSQSHPSFPWERETEEKKKKDNRWEGR